MRTAAVSFAAALIACVSACVLVDIDYTGKTCPCPAEYECDSATNTCREAGAGTKSMGGGVDCVPTAISSTFRIGWATPNTILWQWDPPQDLALLNSYRLIVATTEEAVMSETGALIFTSAENAELGEPYLIGDSDDDAVQSTITDGLEPDTTYFARLATKDNAGCEHFSNVLSEKTARAFRKQLTLFEDTPRPGSEPSVDVGAIGYESCPATGSNCIQWTNGATEVWENVRMRFSPGLSVADELVDPPDEMSAGDFASTAYYEISVGTDSQTGPTWAELRISTGGNFFVVSRLVFRADGAMHSYQIPLNRLTLQNGDPRPMNHDDVLAGLAEFSAGSGWTPNAHVWIDDVYLRW